MASNRSRRTGGHGHGHRSGSLVDENMIVLRNQIHELQLVEKNQRHPPDGWMDSEWRYYCSSYGADLCDVAAIRQSLLINTRPGVSVAVGSLFAFYLPTPPSSSPSISWKP
ncbi:hypothetical protein HPP92_027370 [Vanilla planifolia]|uniref:Uncharacterized protein n=1 Tax=Vanilla planifolia TaxID=51239 RepID=A0A835PC59_VANPL|nr:hypothetical protein HPP92_027370 [Vanilla planifolia]